MLRHSATNIFYETLLPLSQWGFDRHLAAGALGLARLGMCTGARTGTNRAASTSSVLQTPPFACAMRSVSSTSRPLFFGAVSPGGTLPRDPTDPRQYVIRPPSHIGFVIVPEKQAFVIQRFGRHLKVLESGLHFLMPIFDQVAFVHDLREMAVPIANQAAITRDNVHISIDGVLYVRTVDPVLASYGVQNAIMAVTQLAQTTMRSELGKITLDKTFEERDSLNRHIVMAINEASAAWGLQCLRYEIRDITPPPPVQRAMEMQAEAERRKRAQILDSEGEQQSVINRAEGAKRDIVLRSEAKREEMLNEALGRAEFITRTAKATAESIQRVAEALRAEGASEAASLRVAEQYVEAFGKLAKESNTLMLPTNAGDPASMVAQALGVFKAVGLSGPGATKTVSGTTPGTTSEVGRERVGESVDGAGGRPFKLSK